MRLPNKTHLWLVIVVPLLCSFTGYASAGSKASRLGDIVREWPCARGAITNATYVARLFTAKEIRKRIRHQDPLIFPETESPHGKVILEVVIGTQGQVMCARPVSGNPLALSVAMESFPHWTFEPVQVGAENGVFVGTLEVQFDAGKPK